MAEARVSAQRARQAGVAQGDGTCVAAAPPPARLLRRAGSRTPQQSRRDAHPSRSGTSRSRRIPRGDRVTIELSEEVAFTGERVANPDRIFFDFTNSAIAGSVAERASTVKSPLIKAVRIGSPASGVTRVVLELTGAPRFSSFPLYGPFRLVIDVEAEPPPAGVRRPPAPSRHPRQPVPLLRRRRLRGRRALPRIRRPWKSRPRPPRQLRQLPRLRRLPRRRPAHARETTRWPGSLDCAWRAW